MTGADGFIGSHLVEMLVIEGYKVKALSQYNSFNNWGWLEDVGCMEEIEILTGDIRDPFFCNEICEGVNIIFHLAALIAIPYSYIAPQSYVETNITGTLNICKAALDQRVSRVIHTSTSEVYGSAQYVPIDEAHPLQAQSPYSASKIGSDAMAMSFFNSFELPLTIARPFNTYGPSMAIDDGRVISNFIVQALKNNPITVYGDGLQTRSFCYINDTLAGILKLMNSKKTKKIIKFEQVLGSIDLVSDFNILNFNSESMQYKITYNGTPNLFLDDMRKKNFELEKIFLFSYKK